MHHRGMQVVDRGHSPTLSLPRDPNLICPSCSGTSLHAYPQPHPIHPALMGPTLMAAIRETHWGAQAVGLDPMVAAARSWCCWEANPGVTLLCLSGHLGAAGLAVPRPRLPPMHGLGRIKEPVAGQKIPWQAGSSPWVVFCPPLV